MHDVVTLPLCGMNGTNYTQITIITHGEFLPPSLSLHCRSKSVTLVNFALSKHLVREGDMLSDQRGSLAYVSPDILSGEREGEGGEGG